MDRAELLKMLEPEKERIEENYRRAMWTIKQLPPGAWRATAIHTVLDILVQRVLESEEFKVSDQKISCKKGCSHCCYQPIKVTRDEAELLSKYEYDRDLAKEQSKHCEDTWYSMPYEKTRCVFLKNNECSVYEDRPSACRGYLVLSDPKWCDTRLDENNVTISIMPEVGTLIHSYHIVAGEDSLPRMLLKVDA